VVPDDAHPAQRIGVLAVRVLPAGKGRRLRIPRATKPNSRTTTAPRTVSPVVEQDLHFEDGNRRFTHGTITLTEKPTAPGRPLTITAAGPTGFHLGNGRLLRLE